MTTIKDVAREASVSVATVSRALNGHRNVADDVRRRVVAAAQRLQYTPHHAARSLSSRRTNTIGVVLPDLHGEYFSELMRGIDQAVRDEGKQLLVSSFHGAQAELRRAVHGMRGRVDGLLLMSPGNRDGAHVPEGLAVPAVLVNTVGEDRQPRVMVDNRAGARAMGTHLRAAGRRCIAFIAGPDDNHEARERLHGLQEALAAAGGGEDLQLLSGDFGEQSGRLAAQALLRQPALPDAVFAANDMMAIGCLLALLEAGVDVPGQIAVTGFDDIPLARYVRPALTTVRVDIAALGAAAARLLLDAHADDPAVVSIPPRLVVRQSCGTAVDAAPFSSHSSTVAGPATVPQPPDA